MDVELILRKIIYHKDHTYTLMVECDKACFVIRDVVVQYMFGSLALYSLKSRNVLYKVRMP